MSTENIEWAISTGRIDQLKFLLNNGNNSSQLSVSGVNPLELALRIDDDIRRKKVFNFLLSQGADVTIKDKVTGRDVFSSACLLGRQDQVAKLLKLAPGEFSFRQADATGLMPIHYAVRGANPFIVYHVVNEMKRYGVGIDLPNLQDGLTPLLMAKRLGYDLISQVLLTEGKACPTQFDTNTFRTKTRWSEVGHEERNKAELRTMISELRLHGSTRPHSSFHGRRERTKDKVGPEPKRLRSQTTGMLTRSCTEIVQPSNITKSYHSAPREVYGSLQLSDLKQVVEGRASLENVKKCREAEVDSGIQSSGSSSCLSPGSKGSNTPSDKHGAWSKLQNLMSLSDRASVLSSERFARSVSVTGDSAAKEQQISQDSLVGQQETHNPLMIHSMMTAVSNQMSTSFRKPALPKAEPEPKPKPVTKKRKKGSTLAFILQSSPGRQRRPSRAQTTRTSNKSVHVRSAAVEGPQTRRSAQTSKGYTFGHRSSIRNPTTSRLPAINS